MFDKPKVSEKEFSFFKILIFRLVELASEPKKNIRKPRFGPEVCKAIRNYEKKSLIADVKRLKFILANKQTFNKHFLKACARYFL